MLSPSTITKVLHELTSGEIRSRAGLDNTDVIKGFYNFENMRSLVDTLRKFAPTSQYSDEDFDDLLALIDSVEIFHKVEFERHLGLENGNHACQCLHCGFCCSEKDPIVCPKDKTHDSPCEQCQQSFDLIRQLHLLHSSAKDKIDSAGDPSLEDDHLTWKQDICQCHSYLMDYRAHIAHKKSEAQFDSEDYFNLKPHQAVVIIDFKMKVLASRYREAQQDWFSKRGSSILGAEIHLFSDDKEKKKVLYHFFISDDSFQDTYAVLCAKHFLYTEVLPKHGVTEVKFRSDGACCFSSKEAKAAMKLWDDMCTDALGCYESAYKVSVAGCGKTALDGEF